MAYNLKLTNGTTLVTVGDGVSDTSYSSLTLFGKNFAGYGPLLNENMVHMLENFSYVSAPANPLQGQLWWNSDTKRLSVRSQQDWKTFAIATTSATPPTTNNNIGDQWWDSSKQQLSIYNGTDWSLVGPAFTVGQGKSGPMVESVLGEFDGIQHTITKFYANNEVVAVLSNDATFTTTAIPGFYSIKPGFTLISTGSKQYYGDANNALNLGSIPAANYMRNDVISTTHFPILIKNNSGLTVGALDDLTILASTNEVTFASNVVGKNIDFSFADSLGHQSLALQINGTTGKVIVLAGDPVQDDGVATKHYVDTEINNTASALLKADGTTPIIGNLSAIVNGVYSLGTLSSRFNTVYSSTVDTTTLVADTGEVNAIVINDSPTQPKSATNKAYVDTKVSTLSDDTDLKLQQQKVAIVGTAPANMSTLAAISSSINNDPTFAASINAALNLKAPITNADLLGAPKAPTPAAGDVSSRIATTSFVNTTVTTAINTALATPPASTNIAISEAIDELTQNPTFVGKIIAPAGIQISGEGLSTTSDNTLDIGSSTNAFKDVYAAKFTGYAVNAKYADLAENYVSDYEYGPGTVLDFGGDYEVTASAVRGSSAVAGVVSSNPAYLMNADCKGEHIVALALQGRVPVKVHGPVRKGDMLISAGDGFAVSENKPEIGTVIGKALQNCEDRTGVIEVVIGRC